MKTLFFSILFIGNFFLSTPMASEYSKEELEEQILAAHDDYVRVLRMTFPSTANQSTFEAGQRDTSASDPKEKLLKLLEEHSLLTGEIFILPTESRTTPEPTEDLTSEDSTSDTSPSEQFKKRLELKHEILTIHNDVIKLAAIRIPLNADPSKFKEGRKDLSIAQSILASLLEDYVTLTGEHFILPTESRTAPKPTEEATVYTPPTESLQANTPIIHNGFKTTHVGRNKGNISTASLLREAQNNSLIPVRFAGPEKNLCHLELVRPNKTPKKTVEQNSVK